MPTQPTKKDDKGIQKGQPQAPADDKRRVSQDDDEFERKAGNAGQRGNKGLDDDGTDQRRPQQAPGKDQNP